MLTSLILNLGLLVALAHLGSLTLREWPLKRDRAHLLLHTVLAALASTVLLRFPTELQPGIPVDLGHVPIALIALRYGLLPAAMAALPALLTRTATGSPEAAAALWGLLGVLLIGSALGGLLRRRRLKLTSAWWVAPLTFSTNGFGLLLLPDGAALLQASYLPLLLFNSLGLVAVVGLLQARLRLLRLSHAYRQQALRDPLTGLANRRQLLEDLETLGPEDGLLIVDVDRFKGINDACGHEAGDRVLCVVAETLERSVRPGDRVYRYGGEEFVLLLRQVRRENAAGVSARLLGRVRSTSIEDLPNVRVTVSGGLAFPIEGEKPADTLRRADEALYQAKDAGRDRITLARTVHQPDTEPDPASPLEVYAASAPDPLPRLALWRSARDTLALLASDHGLTARDWHALLEAAVTCVPGAEAGSINLRDGEHFEIVAQVGFSERLLGTQQSQQAWMHYYTGSEEDWRAARPRVLRAAQLARALRESGELTGILVDEGPFAEAGRVHELRASLCMPVVCGGEVVAHFNLDSFSREDAFDNGSIEVAREFCTQASALLAAQRRRQQARHSHEAALETLGLLLEARDFETQGHTRRVARWAIELGEALELSADDLEALRLGALLHDLGKLGVPDRVLLKPGPLSHTERLEMQQHVEAGYRLVQRLSDVPAGTLEVVRSHHERWDGQGYPDRLAGEAIPLLARLFSVVDVYDALISVRPYKGAWSEEEALHEIERQAGQQFDPVIVQAFLRLCRRTPLSAVAWTDALGSGSRTFGR
ncbi:diguanylate cyclase [Deinobacterium chartae]|uniref:Diguanylate cyclase n=1 Tax=Deinobacterium chartae TaxID=521158 RepID=A0A841I258_9DEIO|nr:diguanylate cyclase [Deinobacterium chartae]MBB6099074.1 diguanylate cyclase [Deinobacterium chartae]